MRKVSNMQNSTKSIIRKIDLAIQKYRDLDAACAGKVRNIQDSIFYMDKVNNLWNGINISGNVSGNDGNINIEINPLKDRTYYDYLMDKNVRKLYFIDKDKRPPFVSKWEGKVLLEPLKVNGVSIKLASKTAKEDAIKDRWTNWSQEGFAYGFVKPGADLINGVTQHPIGINPNNKNIIPEIKVSHATPTSEQSKISFNIGAFGGNLTFQEATTFLLMGIGKLGTVSSVETSADDFGIVVQDLGETESEINAVTQGSAESTTIERQFWTNETVHDGVKVYQRNDIINQSQLDKMGRSNVERMEQGLAPLGPDGKSVNLHHLTQTNNSSIAEVTQTFHQENTSVIHINPNTIPSGIDRSAFNSWRTSYWKYRANDFK